MIYIKCDWKLSAKYGFGCANISFQKLQNQIIKMLILDSKVTKSDSNNGNINFQKFRMKV